MFSVLSKVSFIVFWIMMASLPTPSAHAATLTFEGVGGQIANGYGGLSWSNMYSHNATNYQPSGYRNGRVSGDYVAYNAFANPASFNVAAGTFTFVSGYFTAAWNNGLSVRIEGLRGGSTIYDQTHVLNSSVATLLVFNYTNVDTVRISTSGGTDAGYGGGGTHVAIDDLTVAFNVCPNSVVESGEACDDGNTTATDGCSPTCAIESGYACSGSPSSCSTVCGDGIITGTEGCDDGNASGGDGCSASCSSEVGYSCGGAPSQCEPICGDSLVVGDEPCDDGGINPGDGCSASCEQEAGYTCAGEPSLCLSTCGDGIPVGSEECDDGDLNDDDGCSDNCVVEETFVCMGIPSMCVTNCGNGSADAGEGCDDGGRSDGDGCSKVCQVDSGWDCAGAPSDCTPTCGDSRILGGEECDDGNTADDDCCSASCSFEPANGACLTAGEALSVSGAFAGPTSHLTAGWEFRVHSDLTIVSVGLYDCDDNGLAQSHDIGLWDKDGPTLIATATVPAAAGAELVAHFRHVPVTPIALEAGKTYVVAALYPQATSDCLAFSGSYAFDPRITFVTGRELASASPSLTYPSSPNTYRFGPTFLFDSLRGDGVVDGDESCDDGNVAGGDGCSPNGEIESGYDCNGEPSDCGAVCGDGLIVGAETCDDGGAAPGDGCSDLCLVEGTYTCRGLPSECSDSCGDGAVDGGETCDDGNLVDDDGCSSGCTVDPSYFCTGAPSLCTTSCGDGVIDVELEFEEQCDDGNLIDGDCCSKNCLFEPANTACWKSMPVPGGGMESGGVGKVEGWEFSVNRTVTIAALGVFDEPSSTGLAEAHPVGIWNNAQQLLASATVPAGTEAGLINGFRYVPIAGLTLAPGTYTIGAYFPAPQNDSVISAPAPSLDPRLTLITGRRVAFVNGLVFPTSLNSSARVGPALLLELTGCGDGGPDAGESCDDGNLTAGDCCSIECTAFAGTCSDDNLCTTVDTCQAGSCVGSVALNCNDGSACTQDSCDPESGCINDATPLQNCKTSARSALSLKDSDNDGRDKVSWKWSKGDTELSEFGNPATTTAYGLCLFDQSGGVPNPIFDVEIIPGASWKLVDGKGAKFRDTAGLSDGATKLSLKAGAIDKAQISFAGKGIHLNWSGTPLPFDQSPSVLIQLHNSAGECWQSELAGPPLKNDGETFKDREP